MSPKSLGYFKNVFIDLDILFHYMSLTILFKSDLHARSSAPKPPVERKDLRWKHVVTRSKWFQNLAFGTLIPWYESKPNVQANIKPHMLVDELCDLTSDIASGVNEINPQLVVFGGDFFDLSRTTANRDRERQEDVTIVGKTLVHEIDAPTLFLPGNADGIYIQDKMNALRDLWEISGDSWERTLALCDSDYRPFKDGNGNFALKIGNVLVLGLNSVPPAEFGLEDNLNQSFFKVAISDIEKSVPILVLTHHPPFNVLPWYFKRIGEGIPAQKWLINDLHKYVKETGKPALIAAGHCHKWMYEVDNQGLHELCNLPLSSRDRNLGTVIEVQGDQINVSQAGF